MNLRNFTVKASGIEIDLRLAIGFSTNAPTVSVNLDAATARAIATALHRAADRTGVAGLELFEAMPVETSPAAATAVTPAQIALAAARPIETAFP